MTENGKPKVDDLMVWLILATILSLPSLYFAVLGSYYTYNSVWDLFYFFGSAAIMISILVALSWISWKIEKRKLSSFLSAIVVILSVINYAMVAIATIA